MNILARVKGDEPTQIMVDDDQITVEQAITLAVQTLGIGFGYQSVRVNNQWLDPKAICPNHAEIVFTLVQNDPYDAVSRESEGVKI